MAIHKPDDRYIVVAPHATAANVQSALLEEGQFALYDEREPGIDGCRPVTSLLGARTDEKAYSIRFGRPRIPYSRSGDDRNFSSPTFAINEIWQVWASGPDKSEASKDIVLLGYNGVSDDTAFTLRKGKRIEIKVELEGKALAILGYPEGKAQFLQHIYEPECSSIPDECDDCDPCEPVSCLEPTMNAIYELQEQPVTGGYRVEDFVDITPIHKCATAPSPTTTPINFFCIEVCDTGDGVALAAIQNQYPGLRIERTKRAGSNSTYKVIKQGTAPSPYQQRLNSILKGCENCPTGYSEIEGGYVYVVTLNDDGDDLATDVETIPNAIAGTAVKLEGQDYNVGMYTVVTDTKLTEADIETFVTAQPTAKIAYIVQTASICQNPTITTIPWSACGSCEVSTAGYFITIPDDECGNSRLAELRAFYPDLTITNYGTPAGCQHMFQTTVVTSQRCEVCDPVFEDFFRSEPPADFEGRKWVPIPDATTPDPTCMCGIRFEAKDFVFDPGQCFEDMAGYIEDSVRISVSGGYPDDDKLGDLYSTEPLHTEYISKWAPRTHLGGDLRPDEEIGYAYFNGTPKHSVKNRAARMFLNEQSRLEGSVQYADYAIYLYPRQRANMMADTEYKDVAIHIAVEYGAHEGVEEFVNMLAAAAGIKPVKL